jgi:hypothetical protein
VYAKKWQRSLKFLNQNCHDSVRWDPGLERLSLKLIETPQTRAQTGCGQLLAQIDSRVFTPLNRRKSRSFKEKTR